MSYYTQVSASAPLFWWTMAAPNYSGTFIFDERAITTATFFTTTGSLTASVLIVGGGGGGGSNGGGGGGGGGLVYSSSFAIPVGRNLVTVGLGGAGAVSSVTTAITGGHSSIFGIVAYGGGGGGSRDRAADSSSIGGSGGGGANAIAGAAVCRTGSAGIAGQGYAGGNAWGTDLGANGGGGGGGGAGGTGSAVLASGQCGVGGNGLAYNISGISTYYAGGGGGGQTVNGIAASGGLGGGGRGYDSGSGAATSGTPGLGAGGGGGGTGGGGGYGIVIVRYSGSQVATGGTVTTDGGDTIHTFELASGTNYQGILSNNPTGDSYMGWGSGSATWDNGSYYPQRDPNVATSLGMAGWNQIRNVRTRSTGSDLWFMNIATSSFTSSPGFTVEWLYRYDLNWQYSNGFAYMVGWYAPASPYHGWWFYDYTGGSTYQYAGGQYRINFAWISGVTQQTAYAYWSNSRTATTFDLYPSYGQEQRAIQSLNASGSTGLNNGWHHFVLRVNNVRGLILNVDGECIPIDVASNWGPPAAAVVTSASQAFYLGNSVANNSWGSYKDVAVYDRVLSDREVMNHWAVLCSGTSAMLGAVVNGSSSDGHVLYATTQRVANNITAAATTGSTGADPRATKTNPGIN